MNEDYRLCDQNEYLIEKEFYKVSFPEFWIKSYNTKNEFYEKVLNLAKKHVESFPETKGYLEGDKIQLFWHEHCEFCYEKALTNEKHVFYCTKDFEHWVCEKCFTDFKDKFRWKVINE